MKSKKIKPKGPFIGHVQNLTESQEGEPTLKQIIIKALFQPQIHQRQLLDELNVCSLPAPLWVASPAHWVGKMFNARLRLSLNLVSGRGYWHGVEGKGPVGEGEEKNRAGSVMGFVQLSGVTGRWPVLGTAAVLSPPRHATVARVGCERRRCGCCISTDWDRLSRWFLFTMAVLDNHSWQYAQAGKTLIRLSGRVTSPCLSSQIGSVASFATEVSEYMPGII